MLAHECLHTGALAMLDRRNYEMMLTVGVGEHVVHSTQARLVESECLGPHKWNPGVALQRLLYHRTVRFAHDQIVKARIHVRIQRLVALLYAALAENPIAVRKTRLQCRAKCPGSAFFGYPPRGQAFDY